MLSKIRNTLSYKYAVIAGVFIAACMALTAADITPGTVEWTYYIWMPVIYLFIPVFATAWIWILITDLIHKRPICQKSSDNKFLIAAEFLLIAIFLYGSYGTLAHSVLGANLKESLITFAVYALLGGLPATLIKFIIKLIQKQPSS